MKIFLENIFMCLVKFWKCYFPPPHNRKTTKTPPPTPPQQQQKNQRSKRESKKSKSQTNFITKISNENENEIGNGFMGSWCNLPVRSVRCDLRFVGSQCNSSVRWRGVTRGSWVHGATISGSWGSATHRWCDDLGFSGFAISLSLLLELIRSVCGSFSWSSVCGLELGELCVRRVRERADGKCLKWKWDLNSFFTFEALFYGQIENIFSLTQFIGPTKHAIFRKMISEFRLKSKQTDP